MIKNDSRPVYTYGMPFRGFGPGCQPKQGLIDVKDTDRVKTGLWSVITYSRPLTESEISEYELVPIPDNQGNLP